MKAKITIPETLNEIKLYQYQEFLSKVGRVDRLRFGSVYGGVFPIAS